MQYIQEHSTLAKIAASATGELEHSHTQQLCCGVGDPKGGCVRPCGLLKTQTQMWDETSDQNYECTVQRPCALL